MIPSGRTIKALKAFLCLCCGFLGSQAFEDFDFNMAGCHARRYHLVDVILEDRDPEESSLPNV